MPVRLTKDGRTIRTGKAYTEFRKELYYDQHGKCVNCNAQTIIFFDLISDYSFHVAHRGSRGMGGGIRDDVVGPKRGQVEGGKCGLCHRKEHNQ